MGGTPPNARPPRMALDQGRAGRCRPTTWPPGESASRPSRAAWPTWKPRAWSPSRGARGTPPASSCWPERPGRAGRWYPRDRGRHDPPGTGGAGCPGGPPVCSRLQFHGSRPGVGAATAGGRWTTDDLPWRDDRGLVQPTRWTNSARFWASMSTGAAWPSLRLPLSRRREGLGVGAILYQILSSLQSIAIPRRVALADEWTSAVP